MTRVGDQDILMTFAHDGFHAVMWDQTGGNPWDVRIGVYVVDDHVDADAESSWGVLVDAPYFGGKMRFGVDGSIGLDSPRQLAAALRDVLDEVGDVWADYRPGRRDDLDDIIFKMVISDSQESFFDLLRRDVAGSVSQP